MAVHRNVLDYQNYETARGQKLFGQEGPKRSNTSDSKLSRITQD